MEARKIQVRLGKNVILDDVSLQLQSGELLGIVGPNGAGKTTLLRTLSGALKPSRGAIYLDGKQLADLRPGAIARRTAVVSQSEEVAFAFTVRQMVGMGRLPHLARWQREGPADAAAVEGALADAGITHLAERPVTALSGGETRRVLIARALAQTPAVLLLDEPTAHLDIHHQVRIFSLIHRLVGQNGLAVLAVLHDLNLASRYCTRLLLMSAGHVVAAGPPAAVLTRPLVSQVFGSGVEVLQHPDLDIPVIVPGVEQSAAT